MDLTPYERAGDTWQRIGDGSAIRKEIYAKFAVLRSEHGLFLFLFTEGLEHVDAILTGIAQLLGITEQQALDRQAVRGAGLVYASGRVEYGSVRTQSRFHRDRPGEPPKNSRSPTRSAKR